LNTSLQSADTPWWTQVSNINGYDWTAKDLKGKRKKMSWIRMSGRNEMRH
jgi:hypothetical protein